MHSESSLRSNGFEFRAPHRLEKPLVHAKRLRRRRLVYFVIMVASGGGVSGVRDKVRRTMAPRAGRENGNDLLD